MFLTKGYFHHHIMLLIFSGAPPGVIFLHITFLRYLGAKWPPVLGLFGASFHLWPWMVPKVREVGIPGRSAPPIKGRTEDVYAILFAITPILPVCPCVLDFLSHPQTVCPKKTGLLEVFPLTQGGDK